MTDTRRRLRRNALLCLLLAAAVTVTIGGIIAVRGRADDRTRSYLSTDGWPTQGQGAYQVGDGVPHAGGDEQPVPIASLAKVMTALLVLERHPLRDGESGPVYTVTAADVADTAMRRDRDESLVPVHAGQRLTERDELMALLLPSANNVAVMLARQVSGTLEAFVREMNREAASLGMTRTTYTDPSGFDEGTVSTAQDQLTLALAAAANPQFVAMVGTPSYRLAGSGVIVNTDSLLGTAGFAGMKTGSDDAAGGCFMFLAYRSVNAINTPIAGVVLGQRGDRLIEAALYAAKQLVDRVAPDPAHA